MSRIRGRCRGFTVVELLVVVLIIAILIAIVLPSLSKARQAARRMTCASRMRQIGLGVFQYDKDFHVLPNAQWNAMQMLMPYFGLSGAHLVNRPGKCGPKVAPYSTLFKCPSNEFIIECETGHSLSYTPIVDSGYLDGDDDGEPDGNFLYCAWSTCRTGFDRDDDGAEQPIDMVWQMRGLGQSAPDTILFTEYWSPVNRIQYKRPTPPNPPGYMLMDWGGGTASGTINFGGDPAVSGGPIAAVADVGGYTFLSAFAYEAEQTGHTTAIDELLHRGTMNTLQTDGSVIPVGLKNVTGGRPCDIPCWTRAAD